MTRPFDKPALTYRQQVELLRQRGMYVEDSEQAAFYLQHLNYYRLCAYWLPFESDHASHRFRPGTRFSDVLGLYVFDRELRLLVLDAVERIEVSVRSQWAYVLAHLHGPHAHLDPRLTRNLGRWRSALQRLSDEVHRSDETFARHLVATYQEDLPPVWATTEVMSLGMLSSWYANLRPMPARRAIASVFGLDDALMQSWLHHLAYVRNISAHHGRLWNREFTITPALPKRKPSDLRHQFAETSRRVHNTLVVLLYMMDVVSPGNHWRHRLVQHLRRRNDVVTAMGFPTDWADRPIWTGAAP